MSANTPAPDYTIVTAEVLRLVNLHNAKLLMSLDEARRSFRGEIGWGTYVVFSEEQDVARWLTLLDLYTEQNPKIKTTRIYLYCPTRVAISPALPELRSRVPGWSLYRYHGSLEGTWTDFLGN